MKIIAIGGGEIGRPGTKVETLAIDKEIKAISGKKRPKLLFIPTASNDAPGYVTVVEKHFGKKLGCDVDTLYLVDTKLTKREIREKILSVDIVYVGGGNTRAMLTIWKTLGVQTALREAGNRGVVLSGLSAGAVCWFKEANSDSAKMLDPKADYIKIKALNFFPFFVCPHYDKEKERQPSLKKMLKKGGSAIAIDNCAALEIVGSKFKVIASKRGASAYLCRWRKDTYEVVDLKSDSFRPMSLLQKK